MPWIATLDSTAGLMQAMTAEGTMTRSPSHICPNIQIQAEIRGSCNPTSTIAEKTPKIKALQTRPASVL